MTPSTPVATAIAIIAPAFTDSAVVSLRPIASSTRLSRNAGRTPRPADATMSSSTPVSRTRYGEKSPPIWRRFARLTAASAGRSGTSCAVCQNMLTRPGYGRRRALQRLAATSVCFRVLGRDVVGVAGRGLRPGRVFLALVLVAILVFADRFVLAHLRFFRSTARSSEALFILDLRSMFRWRAS